MSYKSENWKEKLEEVRQFVQRKEGSVEKTAEEILNEEIEELLHEIEPDDSFIEEEVILEASAGELQEVTDKEVEALKKLSKNMQEVLKGYHSIAKMGDGELRNTKYNKDYEAVLKARDTIFSLIGKVNTQKILNKEEVKDISVSKLTEKNMLGRLAKQLRLNEEGKQKMFDYFEKGEL